MGYDDAVLDLMDDIDTFDEDWYAGFDDATEIVSWLDEHEDFRIKIEDMSGEDFPKILDRLNEKIENAKEADEPTIFIDEKQALQESEEIDLSPEPDPFTIKFEKPDIEKQRILLQEELDIARKELEEFEEEQPEEGEEEDQAEDFGEEEEKSVIESIKSIGKSIRKFIGI